MWLLLDMMPAGQRPAAHGGSPGDRNPLLDDSTGCHDVHHVPEPTNDWAAVEELNFSYHKLGYVVNKMVLGSW